MVGGIDVDFMVRSTPEEIRARADALLDQTAAQGGYALGTGNSVPEYIPDENYLAMINAARTSNKPLWGFDPRPSDTWLNP